MKQFITKTTIVKAILLIFLSLPFVGASAFGGADSYAIYLNDKLLVKQSLGDPLDLKTLPITEKNSSDKLVIRYMQCNTPSKVGKNRVITLKNDAGKIVKEWKFKDLDGEASDMVIPVKEILALQKSANGALSFYYSADGNKTQKLAALHGGSKSNT
ncbi:MAG: hypothetical protein EOO04_09420 [Chitinophagaceae bacterium]|nr:MAG: hypothetical protein EOO04_09420 [Chitinophagaceae bacterium]